MQRIGFATFVQSILGVSAHHRQHGQARMFAMDMTLDQAVVKERLKFNQQIAAPLFRCGTHRQRRFDRPAANEDAETFK